MNNFRIGDTIIFGRPNGTQTLGRIVKLNPSKAKVETLEERGTGRGSSIGTVWTVPYSLMRLANQDGTVNVVLDSAELPIECDLSQADLLILEAIVQTYRDLSPEILAADGERSHYQIKQLQAKYTARLRALQTAFGRPVSETVAYAWYDQRIVDLR